MTHREDPTGRRPGPSEGTLTRLLREVMASADAPASPWDTALRPGRPDRPVRAYPRSAGAASARSGRRATPSSSVRWPSRPSSTPPRRWPTSGCWPRRRPRPIFPSQHRHPLRRGEVRARAVPGHGVAARGDAGLSSGREPCLHARPCASPPRSPAAWPTPMSGASCTATSRRGTSTSAREAA